MDLPRGCMHAFHFIDSFIHKSNNSTIGTISVYNIPPGVLQTFFPIEPFEGPIQTRWYSIAQFALP